GGSITADQVLLEAGAADVLRTVSAGIGSREGHADERSRICAGAASPGRGRRTGNQAGPDRGQAREGPVRARRGADMARAVPATLSGTGTALFEQRGLSEAHAAHSTHAVHAGSRVCSCFGRFGL